MAQPRPYEDPTVMNRADSDAAWNEKREQKAPDVGDEYDVHDEHASDEGQKAKGGVLRSDGKIELLESEAYDKLGYSFPTWKKWMILSVTFCIQISINLNASLYANAVPAISEKYGISKQAARIPQMTFLVAYGFGCELWAPWSEEYGRWPTQQLSLLLVNIWQIPCALSPNYATYVVVRFLGGLSTAGGSVTLGVVADMWEPDDQEYAVAFLIVSSVGGSVVGAIAGGFVEARHSLAWIFWVQLLVGGFVQIMHIFLVPETRATIMLNKEAKKRRKAGETNVYGPDELKERRLNFKEIMTIWIRPFYMLFTEPIVAWLSAVSGFSDALIFTFLQGFHPVYEQYGFGPKQISLAFLPLFIGYILSYFSFLPSIHYFRQKRRREGSDSVPPEKRLWWLLYVIMLEPIGLIGFAWTSLGPSYVPWIAPMLFSSLVGIANYAIYQSSIDYTVAAYGPYAASATGGNDFARDFLSGIAALYSTPMYSNIGNRYRLEWASTILAVIAIFVCSPIFYFYRNGEKIRLKSKFAAQIEKARREGRGGDISGDRKGSEGAGAEKKEDRGWSRSASMAGISRYPEPGQKRGSKARAGGAKAAKPTVAHDEV